MNINKSLKMKTKLNKITYSFLSLFSVLNFSTTMLASQSVGDVVGQINGGSGVYGTISNIMGILGWLGFGIATIKLVQIGIMFLMSSGTKKSDAKSAVIPWFVGAFICASFGSLGPWLIGMIMGGSSGGSVFDI